MSDDPRRETDVDANVDVVNKLLGTNTTLGIIAGLTLATVTERHQGGDEGDTSFDISTPKTEFAGRSRRRSGAGLPGAGQSAFAASYTTKKSTGAHTATFSVQAPRETIQRLQNHNKLLKQELSIEARAARELLGQEKRSRVEQLRSTLAIFARKLSKTQRQLKRTEQIRIKKTQELATLRLALQPISAHEAAVALANESHAGTPGKPLATAATAAAISGRLRTAENRLEVALARKNEVDSANKHLLGRVDAARRDRTIFDSIYKKLERETSAYKARHEQAKTDLAQAIKAREALAREVSRLENAAKREQLEYEQQFHELKSSIEHWRREMGSRLTSSEQQSSSLGGVFGVTELLSGLDANSEQGNTNRGGAGTLVRVTALSSWKIGVNKALASVPDSLVAKYDGAFATIRERTGLQDASALAKDLLARDAANFKRFKRVEELSREEVALQSQVTVLTSQIKTFKTREGIASRASQKRQCRRVEAMLRMTQQASDELDAEIEERDAILGRIKASVHSVHNTLVHAASGGSMSGTATALGQGITDTNVIEYLQAIEVYTTELMQSKALSEAGENLSAKAREGGSQQSSQTVNSDEVLPLLVGHGPLTLTSDPDQRLHVHVPSFGGVGGVIELPAQVSSDSHKTPEGSRLSRTIPKHSGSTKLSKQQLQCRRLSSRDPLPQRQFAAAITTLTATHSHIQEIQAKYRRVPNDVKSSKYNGSGAGEEMKVDEEEERALTYDELKCFAAKNTQSKRRGYA